MQKFILHWHDGSTEEIEGESFGDAMIKAQLSPKCCQSIGWIEPVENLEVSTEGKKDA